MVVAFFFREKKGLWITFFFFFFPGCDVGGGLDIIEKSGIEGEVGDDHRPIELLCVWFGANETQEI